MAKEYDISLPPVQHTLYLIHDHELMSCICTHEESEYCRLCNDVEVTQGGQKEDVLGERRETEPWIVGCHIISHSKCGLP